MHASNKSDRAKTTEAGGRRAVLRAGLAGSARWKGHREAAGSGGRRDARGQRGIIFCSSTKEEVGQVYAPDQQSALSSGTCHPQ